MNSQPCPARHRPSNPPGSFARNRSQSRNYAGIRGVESQCRIHRRSPDLDGHRSPQGSAKAGTLRVRVKPDELQAIELAARAAGQTMSEFIRGKLLARAGA